MESVAFRRARLCVTYRAERVHLDAFDRMAAPRRDGTRDVSRVLHGTHAYRLFTNALQTLYATTEFGRLSRKHWTCDTFDIHCAAFLRAGCRL